MSIEAFIDYIVSEYEASCLDKNRDDLDHFWKEAVALFSEAMLNGPVIKKSAARVLYLFSRDVMHLRSLEWEGAKKLRDIYECRVCAEAIAQMYERGVMANAGEDIFGVNDIMQDEEIHNSVRKLMQLNTNIIGSL